MTFQHHASHDLLEAVEHWGLEETTSDKRQAMRLSVGACLV